MTGFRLKAILARHNLRGMLMVENTNSSLSEADPSSEVRRRIVKMLGSISGSILALSSKAEYPIGIFLVKAFF